MKASEAHLLLVHDVVPKLCVSHNHIRGLERVAQRECTIRWNFFIPKALYQAHGAPAFVVQGSVFWESLLAQAPVLAI